MNKLNCLVIIMISYISFEALAVKTNINEVTDLFDKNIEDKNQLFETLEKQNKNAESQIGTKEAFLMIEGMNEAKSKELELNNIKDTDLESAGRQKRSSSEYSFYDENELEPDYTKSGNILHKLDADDIGRATSDSFGKLMSKLKDLGIDCKSVKGPIQKEPVYYIDVKNEQETTTEYVPIFCEEPRNKYNCRDVLTVKCIEKRAGEQLALVTRFGRSEMPEHWWGGRGMDGNFSFGMRSTDSFISFNNDSVREEVKQKIIGRILERTKIPKEDIDIEVPSQMIMIFHGQQVYYQLDPKGNIGTAVQGTFHREAENWNGSIRFFYRFKGKETCAKWSLDWNEECTLK